jgi:hypothetical protein
VLADHALAFETQRLVRGECAVEQEPRGHSTSRFRVALHYAAAEAGDQLECSCEPCGEHALATVTLADEAAGDPPVGWRPCGLVVHGSAFDVRQLCRRAELTPADAAVSVEHQCGLSVAAQDQLPLAFPLRQGLQFGLDVPMEAHAPAPAEHTVVAFDQIGEVIPCGRVERLDGVPGHRVRRYRALVALRSIFQYAYFVDDLEAAAERWAATVGAGPFFITAHHRADEFSYRGQPIEADVSYAFGYAGSTQIQLIQQHDNLPSIYLDMFPTGFGHHHIAFLAHDYEAERDRLVADGFELACELAANDITAAYLDTRPAIGVFTELHSITPRILATFDRWRKAHEAWDGVGSALRGHVSGS